VDFQSAEYGKSIPTLRQHIVNQILILVLAEGRKHFEN